MKVFHTIASIVAWRKNDITSRKNKTIGFVPTMGCLHQGHASLIQQSIQDNDYTVVSIFVNPLQFGPSEDLNTYPRTLEKDQQMLESLGVDVLFAPSAKVMYPQGIPLDVTMQRGPFVSVLGVSEMLEGRTRPNFFRGVATVVLKLLNIVTPDVAYFGQKDIQQFIVLDTMAKELFVNTSLRKMPIIRESNGLAMSSRNKYLCQESLELASAIYKGLSKAEKKIGSLATGDSISRGQLLQVIQNEWQPFVESGDFKIDYISIANLSTLTEKEIVTCTETKGDATVISCAVYVTDRQNKDVVVRLIDNVITI